MRLLAPLVLPLLIAAAPGVAKTDPAKLSDMVKTLAAPDFEGRGPGTAGEEKTVTWLVERFKALGLEPGGEDGTFIQKVPMVHTRLSGGTMALGGAAAAQGKTIAVTTVGPNPTIAVNAPLVFVGYGVNAPEAGWDDFKGLDLKGKVPVFLINDPDFEATASDGAKGKFGGRRMTYYGRWTYKFDEAAKRGAVAALIIHDTEGVGYGWSTVNASAGENYDIVRKPGEKIPLQGWIEHEAAKALFARAGLDLDRLRVQARQSDFRPVELAGMRFKADLSVAVDRIESRNVIAKLSGAKRPNETLMFGAHWDAYGKGPDGTIRAGANDDALGVAGVLELARLFKAGKRPDRSLVFALWTGEERGLLGSEYYGAHPLFPLEKTAANLTLDILNTGGKAKNVVLVGNGNSSLDALLTRAAKEQGRVVTPETFSERGLFFRADHFSVVRRGVPSLLIMQLGGAPDLVEGGTAAGQKWLDAYMGCYHQGCDVWSPELKFDSAAQEVDLFFRMGGWIANGRDWPRWRKGFEFEAMREASAAARR